MTDRKEEVGLFKCTHCKATCSDALMNLKKQDEFICKLCEKTSPMPEENKGSEDFQKKLFEMHLENGKLLDRIGELEEALPIKDFQCYLCYKHNGRYRLLTRGNSISGVMVCCRGCGGLNGTLDEYFKRRTKEEEDDEETQSEAEPTNIYDFKNSDGRKHFIDVHKLIKLHLQSMEDRYREEVYSAFAMRVIEAAKEMVEGKVITGGIIRQLDQIKRKMAEFSSVEDTEKRKELHDQIVAETDKVRYEMELRRTRHQPIIPSLIPSG